MDLVGSGGRTVSLTPLGYQFANATDASDANWLVVGGQVATELARWKFVDACVDAHEARALVAWLRNAASGVVAILRDTVEQPDFDNMLSFVEPNLGFGVVGYPSERAVIVRVYLSLEAASPRESREPSIWEEFVDLELDRDRLGEAADAFEQELLPFPPR